MKHVWVSGVLVAGLVCAGCSGSQPAPSKENAAVTAPAAKPADAPAKLSDAAGGDTAGGDTAGEGGGENARGGKPAPQLVALLPAKDRVPGWAMSREPAGFTADNLWERIDGAADSFVAYGVQDVVFAEYRHEQTKAEAVIEIYQLKDALNAFGKYADERYPDYAFVKVGVEGYASRQLVNFWAGPYYVKLRMAGGPASAAPELMKLAEAVASGVKTPGAEPRELAWFPAKDRIAHSARYIAKDVLAQSYLTNAFQVEYTAGAKPSKLLLLSLATPAAAQDAIGRYRTAVEKGGKNIHALTTPGEGGFAGVEGFYGPIAVVRVRQYLAVALGTTTEAAAVAQVTDFARNLR